LLLVLRLSLALLMLVWGADELANADHALILFAAVLVLVVLRDEDTLSLRARLRSHGRRDMRAAA
jgi:hypothetical protein